MFDLLSPILALIGQWLISDSVRDGVRILAKWLEADVVTDAIRAVGYLLLTISRVI